jgi:hypothetical protein
MGHLAVPRVEAITSDPPEGTQRARLVSGESWATHVGVRQLAASASSVARTAARAS